MQILNFILFLVKNKEEGMNCKKNQIYYVRFMQTSTVTDFRYHIILSFQLHATGAIKICLASFPYNYYTQGKLNAKHIMIFKFSPI